MLVHIEELDNFVLNYSSRSSEFLARIAATRLGSKGLGFGRLDMLGVSPRKQHHIIQVYKHLSFINELLKKLIHQSPVWYRSRLQGERHKSELLHSLIYHNGGFGLDLG